MIFAAALALTAACKRREPPPPPQVEAPRPADHLAQGELAEGPDRAFSLRLPAASEVALRFPEAVHVRSSLTVDKLSGFVRARVTGGREAASPNRTTFERVVVPGEPGRTLTVEVRPTKRYDAMRSEMVVRDVTPRPPPDPGATESELRQRAGLTPDGTQLLDPKHMQ